MRGRLSDRKQVRIGDGIDDGVTAALLLQSGQRVADRVGASFDGRERNESDRGIGLARQNAHEVRIGHRSQRVPLHAAFIQRRAANKQMAQIERAPVGRKRRTMQ